MNSVSLSVFVVTVMLIKSLLGIIKHWDREPMILMTMFLYCYIAFFSYSRLPGFSHVRSSDAEYTIIHGQLVIYVARKFV